MTSDVGTRRYVFNVMYPGKQLYTGLAYDMNIFREVVVQLTRRNYDLLSSGLSARARWSGVRNTIHTSGPNLYPRVVQVLAEVWQPPIKRAELFVSTLTLMPDLQIIFRQ